MAKAKSAPAAKSAAPKAAPKAAPAGVEAPVVAAPAAAPANLFPAVAAPAAAPAATPVPLPNAQAPRAVVLRGGATFSAVTLGPKRYSVSAPHNAAAWAAVQGALAAAGGTAPVQAVCKAIAAEPQAARCGSAAGMVAYLVRRGALAAVA